MKIKKFTSTILLSVFLSLFTSFCSFAQLSILFVDDTDDNFQNAETFYEAIEALEYTAEYFDAVAEGAGPSLSEMENYDLIIWHTSTDGVGLHLWEGQDEDNADLTAYLETGGNLWLVGLDFLFDRYGAPTVSFSEGDFVFDFLGIASYDSQSYGDDGNLGVPLVSPLPDAPIPGLADISWNLGPLWWVDGVTPSPGTPAVYKMDGEEYPLIDEACAILKQEAEFSALVYLFDLALAIPSDMDGNIGSVLEYFENLVLGTDEREIDERIILYPNPVRSYFRIKTEKRINSMTILDASGRIVAQYEGEYDKYPVFDLKHGVYTVKVLEESGYRQCRLVKL